MLYKQLLISLLLISYIIVIGYSLHKINRYYDYKKKQMDQKKNFYKLVLCQNTKCPYNIPHGINNVCISELPIRLQNIDADGNVKCICENYKK